MDIMRFTFMVNDEPYCLWDPDIPARAKQFLDSVDPQFFTFLAESHAEQLDSDEHKRRVATAARMDYLHGIETLLTLLGAAAQAPQAPHAWIALAKTERLRSVVRRINDGDRTMHAELRDWDRTWSGLAKLILVGAGADAGWEKAKESFARAWTVFAYDFLEEANNDEYNSLKHGLRIRSGGVKVAVGREPSRGVPPPDSEMLPLGGSDHGSTFFAVRFAGRDGNRSVYTEQNTVNWDPVRMIHALHLIAASVANVVSFMRIVHGAAPGTVKFHRFVESEGYDKALRDDVKLRSMRFNPFSNVDDIPKTTRQQLIEELGQRTKDDT